MDAPVKDTSPKDTPKSQRTRARILDCATRLMVEIGYAQASNARIAEEAKLTRGAMLYHFPNRETLVEALVAHLQAARLARLAEAAEAVPTGEDLVEHAIDAYWNLLRSPAFIAFGELEAIARTDLLVRERLAAAQAEFDQAQSGEAFLRLFQAGSGPRLQASRDLARFMLEGLARASLANDADQRVERLLAVIKRATYMLNRKGSTQELWPDDAA